MIVWGFTGVIVGVVLGLTGAGGAIIAIPLFVHLAKASLTDATVFSLITVLISAALNWFVQRRSTDFAVSLLMSAFSIPGSKLVYNLKRTSPLWVIQGLFIFVCLYSLWSLWKKKQISTQVSPSKNSPFRIATISLSGVFVGAMTTMTGLGGGVILVPWMSGPLKLPLEKAVASSLLTILFASSASLWVQMGSIAHPPGSPEILSLAAGSLVAALSVKKFTQRLSLQRTDQIRRGLLTAAVILSIAGVLF